MRYCIYLRKSRADRDAEVRGEGETLERHEKLLLALAKSQGLPVVNIYKEVVSGETIASRPVMQRLLADVEQGLYDGALVVEVERLARGDTIDQGIVAQTFKLSGTKIITPLKTYDPNNEYDEEYFEFGLFMSRREYKTINRRLQNGRTASVREGKYVGNKPPYGYKRSKIQGGKGFTLEPDEKEAEVVKMIFGFYTAAEERLGVALIARKLNNLGIRPRHTDIWVNSTIQNILKNPVYIGKIRWNARKQVKKMINGEIVRTRPRAAKEEILLTDGLHAPIIDIDTWNSAQEIIRENRRVPTPNVTVTNPLAGLVICGKCGRRMLRRAYNHNHKAYLLCPVTACKNVSVEFEFLETAVINGLRQILTELKLEVEKEQSNAEKTPDIEEKILTNSIKETVKLKAQMSRLHDLLEQGVYTPAVFTERSEILAGRIDALEKEMKDAEIKIAEKKANNAAVSYIPKIENAIEVYYTLESADLKNDMLKSVVQRIVYLKEKGGRWHNDPSDFQIEIDTKI